MLTIKVRDREFEVDVELLSKFDFFQGILELQDGGPIILDMCPYTFKNVIDVIQQKDIINDVAIICDAWGLKEKSELLKKYQCKNKECSNFALEISMYCNLHICHAENCFNGQKDGSDYCCDHTCQKGLCKHYVLVFNFCDIHKCSVADCGNVKYNDLYCIDHSCQKCGNFVSFGSYCDLHRCAKDLCCYGKFAKFDYCSDHRCINLDCKNPRIPGGIYCFKCKNVWI